MGKRLFTTLFLFLTLALGILCFEQHTQAAVRNITLYDGDKPTDWQEEYKDTEYVQESDLYLPGDVGNLSAKSSGFFMYEEINKLEYISSDSSVVQVNQAGDYKILKAGIACVNVNGWDKSGELVFSAGYSFLVGGDVSQTFLEKQSVQAYLFEQNYDSYKTDECIIPFVHAPDFRYCSFEVESDSKNMEIECRMDKEKKALCITAIGTGTANLTVTLNRKQFTVQVTVSDVGINKDSLLMTPKDKLRLLISGYSGKIKWCSSNKKVATVSAKGVVRAKKIGNALIYAQLGNHKMGCAISVVNPKMKKVVKHAKKIARTCKYSQKNRMSDKYYDCSSLVWKSFRLMGKTLGNRNYAPVAADIAQWCAKKKKMVKGGVSVKNVQKMKLRPGDLVFLTGVKNGRYKGIYHVEMFVGYRCYAFRGNKPMLCPCWANRFDGYASGERLVGRP